MLNVLIIEIALTGFCAIRMVLVVLRVSVREIKTARRESSAKITDAYPVQSVE